MSSENNGADADHGGTRRRFLATTAGVAAGTIAGCSAVTSQEFEAAPVRLPDGDREELTVAETGTDSSTTSRSVDAVDGEITITSHTAAYQRGPARGAPTLIEAFLGQVNETPGSGSAIVANGVDLGLEGVTLDGFEEPPSLGPEQVSFVVPGGVRPGSGSGAPGSSFTLAWGLDARQVRGLGSGFLVDTRAFLPSEHFLPVDDGWGPGKWWLHDDAPFLREDGGKVLVALGSSTPEEVFGIPAEEMPGERVDTGNNPFLTGNNPFLLATPASVGFAEGKRFTYDEYPWVPRDVFDAGYPAPLGGATFGLGVLSTPAAEVAGQSANPVASMELTDILTSEQARSFLGATGLTDTGTVEWLSGPSPAAGPSEETTVSVLGEEADLRSYQGVVSGEDGPWGVGVHTARVQSEGDVVVAVGTQRWPVGSGEGLGGGNGKRFTGILGSIIIEARDLTTGVDERLVRQ